MQRPTTSASFRAGMITATRAPVPAGGDALGNARLICQESKRFIGVGDVVRVRVVTLSLNEREPRDSKIGLTMRQAGLGTALWLEEELIKEKEKTEQGAGVVRERPMEKAKGKRKEHAAGE